MGSSPRPTPAGCATGANARSSICSCGCRRSTSHGRTGAPIRHGPHRSSRPAGIWSDPLGPHGSDGRARARLPASPFEGEHRMSDVPGGPTPPPPPPPPPPMMGGPQGGMAPKTLGEILSAAFNIYKANASKLILIVALVVFPLSFISALSRVSCSRASKHTDDRLRDAGRSRGSELRIFPRGRIVAAIDQRDHHGHAAGRDPAGRRPGHDRRSGRRGGELSVRLQAPRQRHPVSRPGRPGRRRRTHPPGDPGLIFLIFLSVSVPVLIVENRRGRAALSRSWNLVKGHFWHAVGVIVVAGHHHGDRRRDHRGDRRRRLDRAVDLLLDRQDITAPFTALVSVLLYLDLRSRSEALTADTLSTELAAAGSSG